MSDFITALTSMEKNKIIPEEYNFFGNLIGCWKIEYMEDDYALRIHGEWSFSWILDGMAIQDVIILPNYEYGTSLRIYNPNTNAWDVVYGYTGNIIQLEARKENDRIVLTRLDDKKRKWIFTTIEDDYFHWKNIRENEHGDWHIHAQLYAKRIK